MNQDDVRVVRDADVDMAVDEEPVTEDADAAVLPEQPVLVLRQTQRRPVGRPAANRQHLFDRKLKF